MRDLSSKASGGVRGETATLLIPLVVMIAMAAARPGTPLRVCADPNNLPFSNQARAGFENKIADLIAADLGRTVEYTWWAQRRGFVRNTLNSQSCDVVLGVTAGMELLATTRPYYRSTYVFVSRHDRALGVKSFDDAKLRTLKIGVQLVGDDGANTPPAHALATRGLAQRLVGYTVYGDYRQASPASKIIDAVVANDVDVAVVWGPLAGFAAKHASVPLDIVPVSPQMDLPYLPFVFDIAMGVRRGDSTFRHQLDDFIARRQPSIDSVLDVYGVPRVGRVSHANATGAGGGASE
jgi:quinoprotein dehydrogenase-associated probable ABC transporter substrate-binding protein